MITGVSTSMIQAVKIDSTAAIAVTLPIDLQVSGTPVSGKYQVQCLNDNGEASLTRELEYNSDEVTTLWTIQQDCHQVFDGLQVIRLPGYKYKENGIGMRLRFSGLNYDPGQYKILPGNVTVLTGTNLQYKESTVVPFGGNIFYEPIPFEMLRTFEAIP
jgi:hypothetical protein